MDDCMLYWIWTYLAIEIGVKSVFNCGGVAGSCLDGGGYDVVGAGVYDDVIPWDGRAGVVGTDFLDSADGDVSIRGGNIGENVGAPVCGLVVGAGSCWGQHSSHYPPLSIVNIPYVSSYLIC